MLTLVNSTVADNIASAAANIGVGERLDAFGSVIGPAKTEGTTGDAQPTDRELRRADRRARSGSTS